MLALAGGFAADGGPAHGHRETYGGPGMHPMVKPALRRGWRDLNTVQFGMTPAHALTLAPVDTDRKSVV